MVEVLPFPGNGRKEKVMSPRSSAPDQRPLRPDPEHEKSPTQSGIFIAFFELFGAAFILAVGIRFITDPIQPDAVAYGAFVLTAVLLVDAARRLFKISTGRAKR